MTTTRGVMEMRMPGENLGASGGDGGGGERCLMCTRPRRGSSKLCGRCRRRSRTDITRFLPRRRLLRYCPGCSCYIQPPCRQVRAEPNSISLLNHCILCIWRPLTRPIRILKAEFIESSDHDIFKVKLHLRGEISQGAISDGYHLTEFTIRHEICESCSRSPTSDPQMRVTRVELSLEHPEGRRTLAWLEMALSKHGIPCRAVGIVEHRRRTDFMFSDRTHALDLVQFVEGVVPVKKKSDDDGLSATFFSLHILPICRNDLIRLPNTISRPLLGGGGNLDPLVICTKVSAHGISLMDPFTLQAAFLTAEDYWRAPFHVMLYSKLMVEYLVLDIVMITPDAPDAHDGSYCLVHAHIVRVSDLGKRDDRNKLVVRTHLGRLLKPGDYVLGYDVGSAGSPATEVILVKKGYRVVKKEEEESIGEPRSMDTGLDGIRKDEYEELLRGLEDNLTHLQLNSTQQVPGT